MERPVVFCKFCKRDSEVRFVCERGARWIQETYAPFSRRRTRNACVEQEPPLFSGIKHKAIDKPGMKDFPQGRAACFNISQPTPSETEERKRLRRSQPPGSFIAHKLCYSYSPIVKEAKTRETLHFRAKYSDGNLR